MDNENMVTETKNKDWKMLKIQIALSILILCILFVFCFFKYREWEKGHKLVHNLIVSISSGVLATLLAYKTIHYFLGKKPILGILFLLCTLLIPIGLFAVLTQYTNSVYSSPKMAIIITNIVNSATIVCTIIFETIILLLKKR